MKLSIPESVILQQLDDELVLLDINSGRYFGLPAVGARAWQCAAQSGDSEQVFDVLLQEYKVDADTLRHDLDAFFEALLAAGLMTTDAT